MDEFLRVTADLLEGFGTTVYIFAVTLALSLPLGLLISLGMAAKFKPLAAALKGLVWVVRGTPLMLQIIAIFYGPALIAGVNIFAGQRTLAVIVAFVINYACYFSEIFRGGMEGVPRGQREAAQALGMTRYQIFTRVILLQIIKRVTAPISNEVMSLVKDTSLARIISVGEIIMAAQDYTRAGLIWPIFYTGVFYLVFIGALTLLFGFIEKKLDYIKI